MSTDERTNAEPWPEPPVTDLDADGLMRPPWIKFPNLPRGSAGWRMGMGESYLENFQVWWTRQTRPVHLTVRARYPEPQAWAGFWQSQAGASHSFEPTTSARLKSGERPDMPQQLLSLIGLYISSLEAALECSVDGGSKDDYRSRVRAAKEIRDALLGEDIARAASILSEEQYTIGHIGMHGPGGDEAHYHFTHFAEALTLFRLANRPDAGFGH